MRASGCRNGNLRPDQAAGIKLCGLFRKKNVTVASRSSSAERAAQSEEVMDFEAEKQT
ncbi:hypothetical protein HV146_22805 [Escherichia coli]|nr:hypothetical protein HV146_22805 [Escherichia coli]